MKHRLLHRASDGLQTFALIFDAGDEVLAQLQRFAEQQALSAAHFTAIGAFQRVTVAWFNWDTKQYEPTEINEQVEVLTLGGDVATKDDKPSVHAHLVVAKRDGTAHGGHLQSATVRPTLELILTETPAHLRKRFDPASALPLIAIEASDSGAQPRHQN